MMPDSLIHGAKPSVSSGKSRTRSMSFRPAWSAHRPRSRFGSSASGADCRAGSGDAATDHDHIEGSMDGLDGPRANTPRRVERVGAWEASAVAARSNLVATGSVFSGTATPVAPRAISIPLHRNSCGSKTSLIPPSSSAFAVTFIDATLSNGARAFSVDI